MLSVSESQNQQRRSDTRTNPNEADALSLTRGPKLRDERCGLKMPLGPSPPHDDSEADSVAQVWFEPPHGRGWCLCTLAGARSDLCFLGPKELKHSEAEHYE